MESSNPGQNHALSVFGLGYVGTVCAACLAEKGNPVVGVDINPAKVELLGSGRSPIVEKDIEKFVAGNHRACRLRATTDAVEAVQQSAISFVCVGTPGLSTGEIDLNSIRGVCRELGRAIRQKSSFHQVVLRSTLLPGTTESIVIPTLEDESGKRAGKDFAVCVNPEFMREGSAVADFFHPPFTVLGAADPSHIGLLRELYHWVPGRIFETSLNVAEMVKYACNAFHGFKVAFGNELGSLCKNLSVDTEKVMEIFTSDTNLNISPAYLKPGFAFGGSCLSKDLRALLHRGRELELRLPLLESALPSNAEHLERAVQTILRTRKKKVGLVGLSFKARTDDLRESPLVQLVRRLLDESREVRIWDECVSTHTLIGTNRQFFEKTLPELPSLLCASLDEVVQKAEVLVVGTSAVAKENLTSRLRSGQIIVDLVHLEKAGRPDAVGSYIGICW